jgi:uncharacterized membrane protein (Fun14 family)
MHELLQLLPDSAPTLGFGGVAGLIVGYTAKKLTKLAAILLGVLFIAVQLLAYYGFITVNWGNVQETAVHVWRGPEGATLADQAWHVLSANLPFAGGFAGGFAVGFKLG